MMKIKEEELVCMVESTMDKLSVEKKIDLLTELVIFLILVLRRIFSSPEGTMHVFEAEVSEVLPKLLDKY